MFTRWTRDNVGLDPSVVTIGFVLGATCPTEYLMAVPNVKLLAFEKSYDT